MHKKEEIDEFAPKPEADGGDAKSKPQQNGDPNRKSLIMRPSAINHDDLERAKLLVEDDPLKPEDPHMNTRGRINDEDQWPSLKVTGN